MFDLTKYGSVHPSGIHRSRWIYMDGFNSRAPLDERKHLPDWVTQSEFNQGLKVASTRVNCLRKRHLIVIHPNGRVILVDHLHDKEERDVASALLALGGELQVSKRKCRCEIVRDAIRQYVRYGWGDDLKVVPKPLRASVKSLHQLSSRRRRRDKRAFPKVRWKESLQRRRDAWRSFLEGELILRCSSEFRRSAVPLLQLWRQNFFGGLYGEGFFYTIVGGEDTKGYSTERRIPRRAIVVAQDDECSDSGRRRVLFHSMQEMDNPGPVVPLLRYGWAKPGTITIRDSERTKSRHYMKCYDGATLSTWELGKRAIEKRFQPGVNREVEGWVITV